MPRRINARLSDDFVVKVDTIRRLTDKTTTEVLKSAIDLYHQSVVKENASSLRAFEDAGFLGCASGPQDLSVEYKSELLQLLARKAPRT